MSRDELAGLAERLMEMELRYMEQQALLEALDDVVREQDAVITRLAKELDQLRQAMAGDGDGDAAPWDE